MEPHLKPVQSVPFYLLWIVSAILSVLDWLLLRSAASALAALIAASVPIEKQIERNWYLRWTVPAVDKIALVVFGIAAVLSIMTFDYIYRNAIIKHKVRQRFTTITAIQVGLLILSVAIITLTGLVLGSA